jgi:hypothetical protein
MSAFGCSGMFLLRLATITRRVAWLGPGSIRAIRIGINFDGVAEDDV